MLLLTLIGCPSPFALREYDCGGHNAILVVSTGALDAAVVEEQPACVVARPNQPGATVQRYELPFRDFSVPYFSSQRAEDPLDRRTRAAAVFQAPNVRHTAEGIQAAQYQWRTQAGELSSISSFDGLRVISKGQGRVGVDAGGQDTYVSCTDCEVWIPQDSARLRLDVINATVHVCVGSGTSIELLRADNSTIDLSWNGRPRSFDNINFTNSRLLIRAATIPDTTAIGMVPQLLPRSASICQDDTGSG